MQMPGQHEVMVVSEPSMMGTDITDEDERSISRVVNSQYDQNANNTTTLHALGESAAPSSAGPTGLGLLQQAGPGIGMPPPMPPHSVVMNGS